MTICVGLCQDGEVLEAATKKFEDLEFQQLERESSLEEERETISQQLLQERAQYHSSVAKRKVRKRLTEHVCDIRIMLWIVACFVEEIQLAVPNLQWININLVQSNISVCVIVLCGGLKHPSSLGYYTFYAVFFRRRCLLWRTRLTSSASRHLRSVSDWLKTEPSRCKCSKRCTVTSSHCIINNVLCKM